MKFDVSNTKVEAAARILPSLGPGSTFVAWQTFYERAGDASQPCSCQGIGQIEPHLLLMEPPVPALGMFQVCGRTGPPILGGRQLGQTCFGGPMIANGIS